MEKVASHFLNHLQYPKTFVYHLNQSFVLIFCVLSVCKSMSSLLHVSVSLGHVLMEFTTA